MFDRVFGMDATQEAVFKDTALPLLEGVLDGYNATVFAYGVSDRVSMARVIAHTHTGDRMRQDTYDQRDEGRPWNHRSDHAALV